MNNTKILTDWMGHFFEETFILIICSSSGLERDKFDNKTVSFEEHIKSEHNMWHYLYFLVLVKVKDPTEYTGPESYVAQMIKVSLLAQLIPLYSDP